MGFQDRKFGSDRGPRRFNNGPREMHKITCSGCGTEAEVPFKPAEGRPVYCKDCYQKQRADQPSMDQ